MNYDFLPSDPVMLMSFVNTKLRDVYQSLDDLCDDMHIDKDQLVNTLDQAGFTYNKEKNRFW